MEELWPLPTSEVAEAIRAVSQRLLSDTDGLTDAVAVPARTAQNEPNLLSDASLAEEISG